MRGSLRTWRTHSSRMTPRLFNSGSSCGQKTVQLRPARRPSLEVERTARIGRGQARVRRNFQPGFGRCLIYAVRRFGCRMIPCAGPAAAQSFECLRRVIRMNAGLLDYSLTRFAPVSGKRPVRPAFPRRSSVYGVGDVPSVISLNLLVRRG